MDFLALAYVDDVWAYTFKDLSRAEKLAVVLRVSGHLLLGYSGCTWNIPKAEKEGFVSVLHKYSGGPGGIQHLRCERDHSILK